MLYYGNVHYDNVIMLCYIKSKELDRIYCVQMHLCVHNFKVLLLIINKINKIKET